MATEKEVRSLTLHLVAVIGEERSQLNALRAFALALNDYARLVDERLNDHARALDRWLAARENPPVVAPLASPELQNAVEAVRAMEEKSTGGSTQTAATSPPASQAEFSCGTCGKIFESAGNLNKHKAHAHKMTSKPPASKKEDVDEDVEDPADDDEADFADDDDASDDD